MLRKSGSEGRSHHSNGLFPLRELGSVCSTPVTLAGPLTISASLVAEHRLQTRRLSNCGSRAQSLRGMWDLPRPGLEPVSPALAGRLPTTAPPGKPSWSILTCAFSHHLTLAWCHLLPLLPLTTSHPSLCCEVNNSSHH